MNSARIIHTNGADLCIETFGDSAGAAVLLNAGAAQSMDWWEDGFCRQLARGGRFVIRYDYRDTGRSTTYEPGAPGYGFDDLVADAVGLLDALDVDRAHVAGLSLGGGIAQRLALDHGDRVASLALLSTTPGLRPGSPPRPDLPSMSDEVLAHFTRPVEPPDWTDRVAVIDHIVSGQRLVAGSWGFDESHLRRLLDRVLDRTVDIAATTVNTGLIKPGDPYGTRLGEIAAPALVIHGTADPLFPYPHAEALAREIPDATLYPIPGLGHQMPPPATWDTLVPALLRHTGTPARAGDADG
jgi:pimeloyl-ACP methyl ester carboxylesterase